MPGPEPIRVLLVEDSDVYRESLVFLLGRRVGLEVVGAVATGGAAARACTETEADVVVIDYRLPDIEGSEAAEDVRDVCPGAAIVFLSASVDRDDLGAPLVRKDEGVDRLVEVVRAAAERRTT